MEMKNSEKRRSSLKGFTLIELVIVIAIIAILMSMISLAITGFTNDARRETADEQARMVSQSFQSLLTEYEIRGITLDKVKYTASTGEEPLFCSTIKDTLTLEGDSSNEEIIADDVTLDSKAYDIITKNFEPGFQGAFYIDYNTFSYSVNYVLYTEMTYAKAGSTSNGIDTVGESQLANHEAQKNILKTNGIVIGCYPYSDDLS